MTIAGKNIFGVVGCLSLIPSGAHSIGKCETEGIMVTVVGAILGQVGV